MPSVRAGALGPTPGAATCRGSLVVELGNSDLR
jgi:hypothetical protein